MKKAFFVGLMVSFGMAGPLHAGDALHMTTEDYAPYNFIKDGEIVGIGGDQIKEMMARAGLEHEAEMMPWARALNLAEKRESTCVFTTAHTDARHERFKWVEPLFVDRAVVARYAGSDLSPQTAEELAQYRIGTQTGDYTIELLGNIGVTQVDTAKTLELSIIKLLKGRVDFVSLSENVMTALRKEGVELEPIFTLSEAKMAIACNKAVPDETIEKMQAALDSMREDGFQAAVIEKYQ